MKIDEILMSLGFVNNIYNLNDKIKIEVELLSLKIIVTLVILDNSNLYKIYKNKIIENRIIFLNGEINNESTNEVIMQLLYLDSINNNDIKLYINSNGGDVVQGLAIIDCINTIKSNVKTVCVGACYSMAAIILMCGTKGKRMMLPNSEIMIHEVSGTIASKFNDISLSKERMNEKNNKIISLIVEKTKLKKNEVVKMLKTDTFLNSNKSLLYGFIDNVIL